MNSWDKPDSVATERYEGCPRRTGYGGQLPDWNRDETGCEDANSLDQTWYLYDGQLIDEEWYVKFKKFVNAPFWSFQTEAVYFCVRCPYSLRLKIGVEAYASMPLS